MNKVLSVGLGVGTITCLLLLPTLSASSPSTTPTAPVLAELTDAEEIRLLENRPPTLLNVSMPDTSECEACGDVSPGCAIGSR